MVVGAGRGSGFHLVLQSPKLAVNMTPRLQRDSGNQCLRIVQPQEPGMDVSMVGSSGDKREFRWLASANANSYGVKARKMCRRSTVAVLLAFSVVLTFAKFVLRAGWCENQSLPLGVC